jgi:cytoskeleton protein RodZ
MAKGSFGEILKREREMREVTLNEVTVATRIPPRYLEAFECEDWGKLPGGAFNRGFVRAIARYLGLNEERLLSEYDLAYGEQKAPALPFIENPIPSPPKWAIVIAALGVLLVVAGVIAGGIYGWRRYAAHRGAKHAAALPAVSPPPEKATPPALPASAEVPLAGLDLALSTSGITRVGVVADAKIVLNANLPAAEASPRAPNFRTLQRSPRRCCCS